MSSIKKPELIVMVGLPGSGKSTIRHEKYPTSEYTHLSTDDLIESVAASQGKTYSEVFQTAIKQATKDFESLCASASSSKVNVVVDRTNLTRKSRKILADAFPDYHKKLVVVICDDPVEHQRRLDSRLSVKSIPDFVIDSMKKNFEMPTEDEEFDEIIIIRN